MARGKEPCFIGQQAQIRRPQIRRAEHSTLSSTHEQEPGTLVAFWAERMDIMPLKVVLRVTPLAGTRLAKVWPPEKLDGRGYRSLIVLGSEAIEEGRKRE